MAAQTDLPAFGRLMRFLYQFIAGLVWVWENAIRPVTRTLFWRPFRFLFRFYREKIWTPFVVLPTGHFSRKRAGFLIVATISAFYLIWPAVVFTAQLGLYLATGRQDEVVYLTQTQEFADDVHSIKGCDSLPCNQEAGITFRASATMFNHLWNLAHHGEFFYPDLVAAAVPPGLNKCTATSYGFRYKTLMRRWEVYPDILEVQCIPVKE